MSVNDEIKVGDWVKVKLYQGGHKIVEVIRVDLVGWVSTNQGDYALKNIIESRPPQGEKEPG